MVVVSRKGEERKVSVVNDDITHASYHRIEHIERVECNVTKADCIDIRIVTFSNGLLNIRNGFAQESCSIIDGLALWVTDHYKCKISLRRIKFLEFKVATISFSFGHNARGIEKWKMIEVIQRNLILSRYGIVYLTGEIVLFHLIDTIGICLYILVTVRNCDSGDSFSSFLVCNDTGEVYSFTEYSSVDFSVGQFLENRLFGITARRS